MIRQEDVYKIGRIGRTHGTKGEVNFQFTDDVFDRIDADYVIIEVEGILVPFFIEEYRFRSDETAILKLSDIDTLEQAQRLINCLVFFEREKGDETDDFTWMALVGYTIVDATTHKPVGTIAKIDDSTLNILFETTEGVLIPANNDLIVAVDRPHRKITIHIPDGILELQ